MVIKLYKYANNGDIMKELNGIEFYVNGEKIVEKDIKKISLLDYLRDKLYLRGAKKGCGDGDCGACTVLIGEYYDNKWHYRSVNSCIYPLFKVNGKSVITIEGISQTEEFKKIEKVLLKNGAVQCGFCSPGFVMSIVNHFINEDDGTIDKFKLSLTGNLCRCTGYYPFIKSYGELKEVFEVPSILKKELEPIKNNGKINIEGTDIFIASNIDCVLDILSKEKAKVSTGWTDFFIQGLWDKYDTIIDVSDIKELRFIKNKNGIIEIGCCFTIKDVIDSIENTLPKLSQYLRIMASPQIRNIATICGNIGNASPIADSTVMLSSLDAKINLLSKKGKRTVLLREFYESYKKIKKKDDEIIYSIEFDINGLQFFDFIKFSKREDVDIASVNSALAVFKDKSLWSLGGVLPYVKTFVFDGNIFNNNPVKTVEKEIFPISDVRGSEEFRRMCVKNAFIKHKENYEKE